MIKAIYEKPTTNNIFRGERLKVFPLELQISFMNIDIEILNKI